MEAILPHTQMAVNLSTSKYIYQRPFYEKTCKMAFVRLKDENGRNKNN
jgi:hypothetical protein